MIAAPVPKPRSLARRALLFVLLSLVVLGARPAADHVRAARLLSGLVTTDAETAKGVSETLVDLAAPQGPVRARVYRPSDARATIVLVQGMHRLGIEEPRLQRFARAIAASGYAVVTPEVRELSDYRVDARSVETVGAAILDASRSGARVGVMGTSFGGGIALLAAADPRFADHVSFVAAIGAHGDLGRVTRYFVTGEAEGPDGARVGTPPHSYGAMILVYMHITHFFAPGDVEGARESIKLWLWERGDDAKAHAAKLSPEGRARVLAMFDAKFDDVRPALVALAKSEADAMRAASPEGHLATLKAPVFLLAGDHDPVVPPSETRWLERALPDAARGSVVVTPAIKHVEIEGKPTAAQTAELVHWMGLILGAARG